MVYNRGREKVNLCNGSSMDALLLNAYQQLHLRLSESPDGPTSTALAPFNQPVNGKLPVLPVHVPPVIKMVQDGWGHGEVPVMMSDVMSQAHRVVNTFDPMQPVWSSAMKSFIEMVKVTVETLKPCKGNGLSITNNVMLDSLREVRI